MNPLSTVKLTKVLKALQVAPSDYINAAQVIAQEYFSSGEIISRFIKACYDIDYQKARTIGPNGPTDKSNTIMYLLADHAIMALLNTDLDQALKAIISTIEILSASKNPNDIWIAPKYMILRSKLEFTKNSIDWMSAADHRMAERIAEQYGGYRDLKLSVNDMFKELVDLRCYGVKPCIFEDGIYTHSKRNFWAYAPVDYFNSKAAERYEGSPKNGMVQAQMRNRNQIANALHIASVVVNDEKQLKVQNYDTSFRTTSGAQVVGVAIESFATYDIGYDGKLYATNSPGISFEEIAFKLNLAHVYEILRMNAIMRLYDLIVPLKIVESGPRMPYVKKNLLGFKKIVGSLDPTLILKRVRTIFENRSLITNELEIEVEEAIQKPESVKVQRDVIWHTRILPKGYKASESAKALAKEYLGRELLPGETFVVAHKRNIGGLKQNIHTAKVVR